MNRKDMVDNIMKQVFIPVLYNQHLPFQKFQILQDFVNHRDYILYGIFHTKVEFKENMKMLFRYNKHNKYTHIDLSRAKELGLQVILIQDNTPNALIYKKEVR